MQPAESSTTLASTCNVQKQRANYHKTVENAAPKLLVCTQLKVQRVISACYHTAGQKTAEIAELQNASVFWRDLPSRADFKTTQLELNLNWKLAYLEQEVEVRNQNALSLLSIDSTRQAYVHSPQAPAAPAESRVTERDCNSYSKLRESAIRGWLREDIIKVKSYALLHRCIKGCKLCRAKQLILMSH